MKKQMGILLALVLCLVLTACTPGGPGEGYPGGNGRHSGVL